MLWSLRPTHPDHFIAGRRTQQQFGSIVNRNTNPCRSILIAVIRSHLQFRVSARPVRPSTRGPDLRQPSGAEFSPNSREDTRSDGGRVSQRGGSNRARIRLRAMIRLMVSKGLLTLVGAVGAWAQGSPTNRPQFSAEAVERGRAQFAQSCAFCHGPNANGGTHGPSLVRSVVVRHDENGNLIAAVIREGRTDQGMPAIQLAASQVADIVTFLKSRIAAADIRSANRPVQGSGDQLLTGNAEAGKAFFHGAGGCSGCHSSSGDLAGIARKYAAPVLQARFLYPQQRRATATVTDAAGKQYSGDLLVLTL